MGHRARKRFGQNFLHDPQVIRRLLAAIAVQPGDHVVEIGPGQGALTWGLLEQAKRLDVIELDRDLIAPLRERLGVSERLLIHQGDALEFDLHALTSRPAELRIVGNLPYNISTPLLFHLLAQLALIRDLHLMLQKEVVERIAASPGSKTYGRLSIMVQTHCAAINLFRIGPGAFKPVPKVESAFLRLIPWRPLRYPLADPGLHARIVAAAFGQRRKTLRNSLEGLVPVELIERAGLNPQARAERIDVEGYARLANLAADAVTAS
ncbi:16S rRNA (adenine(1518)-N(6)/adenine(1519)-N(6))-dimethyltransferase RsmA [Caldichromatium japonicum]|uniref:Ribosomal RNA small subunit methyltransferase A n=1 Tax=Caldichromatium japonicum TaxID=2699430 RepID=A0A6G7VAN8_9GAMM|nr:16S rRNA (adenine(1518)-N(6)/adenine(1519)-N(6))-dimethyltransferase RsmA [Caldichromatium japonicum]QIK36970.1 16S rRNA (adenine(1518)-N(6)/adenine(1519)-N(6))-dimethyltransferase RsmA [Caldichromatium japonicum]